MHAVRNLPYPLWRNSAFFSDPSVRLPAHTDAAVNEVLSCLKPHYRQEVYSTVANTYLATVGLRYLLAIFLWLNHADLGFATMFWGDSATYDALGAAVAQFWAGEAGSTGWTQTVEGHANRGFIYFVGVIYYVFGRNTLLVQFLNGIIGALTAVVIFDLGLRLYDFQTARRAMLFTAFFPQMIFWSAALYKDAAVMLCIALSIWALVRLKNQFQFGTLVVYLLATASLIWLRFYIFFAIAGATVAGFFISSRRSLAFRLLSQMAVVTAMIVLLLLTPAGKEMISQSRFLDLQMLQTSRSDLAARADTGYARDADVSTTSGLLRVLPMGVAYLLFAPFPWTVSSFRQLLSLPDILIWYALMPALLIGLKSAVKERLGQSLPILVFTASLTLAYGAFLGNAGTAYRQRTQIMMFYFLFIADGLKKQRTRETPEESLEPRPVLP